MKIKSNDPIWKDVYSQSKLPASLEGLKEMSTNLWWVWNHEGAKLFGKIDPALWKKTEGNPVQLLQNLSFQRTEEILADKELMAEITKVYADFKAYMNVKPDQTKPSVAYFSMEYGLTNVLKIYSGGLGVLAGDYLKEASDSNVDMCAVGFLYRYGYFTQTLSMATAVVGWGIIPMPKVDAETLGLSDEEADAWERKTLKEVKLWAENSLCDAERSKNFWTMQNLSFLSMLVSGDCFALFGMKPNKRTPIEVKVL